MNGRVVVVGAGVAGATAATTLRGLGHEGPVHLVGGEPELPYERPALSKSFLAGETGVDDLLVHAATVYDAAAVQLHLGVTALALDLPRQVVRLSDGDELEYDALVIASGSVNRRPAIPGMPRSGVHQLRTVADAEALRSHASRAATAVVVGQGFIGCEVAATLRGRGLDVTMVDPQPGPLLAPLGASVSRRVADWHEAHGVRLRNGVGVAELTGDTAVDGVGLSDGSRLPADLVVVGVGARPATDWLAGSGIALEHGAVQVDAEGRSSAPRVHAAGDVAAWWDAGLGRHRRIEHDDAARDQGERVAHAVLGLPAPVQHRSWFWSQQYSHVLQHAGVQQDGDELLWRGGRTGFWLRAGRITAVVAIDDGRQFRRATGLIGLSPDRAALLDEEVDLRSLAPARAARACA